MNQPTPYAPGAVKPGWTTTEFWQTVLIQAVAAFVAIAGIVKPGVDVSGLTALVPAMAVAAGLVAQVVYTVSRARVKSSASLAAGSAAAAPVAEVPGAAQPPAAAPPAAAPPAAASPKG